MTSTPVASGEVRTQGFALAFARRGVSVVVEDGADNSMRMRSDGSFEVWVEGFPNLVHEFVHFLFAERIADDHGFDYGRIPLTLERIADREIFWQEIACAVVSCAYLADDARVQSWFAEQLEIQPVFFGLEAQPLEFLAQVRNLVSVHADEVDRVLERAFALVDSALAEGGVPAAERAPLRRFDLRCALSTLAGARGP